MYQAPTHTSAETPPIIERHVRFEEPGPLEMEIDEYFTVIRVTPGGQAARMGVKIGYKMVAFNGKPNGSRSLSECMNTVRVTPRPWIFVFEAPGSEVHKLVGNKHYLTDRCLVLNVYIVLFPLYLTPNLCVRACVLSKAPQLYEIKRSMQ